MQAEANAAPSDSVAAGANAAPSDDGEGPSAPAAPPPPAGSGGSSGAAPKPGAGTLSGAAGRLAPIAAFVRIKPLSADPSGGTASSKRIASWDAARGTIEMEVGGRSGRKAFDFPTAVLPPECTQEHVYNTVAAPLVAQFCAGIDVDLISYGQTGAGKTFTMFGPPHVCACVCACACTWAWACVRVYVGVYVCVMCMCICITVHIHMCSL